MNYAPDEPKRTMLRCLLVATSMTGGMKLSEITEDVVSCWTAKAIRFNVTPEELNKAFDRVTDSRHLFPTWHSILEAVRFYRSFAPSIVEPPKPKALPEPISDERRRDALTRIDALIGAKCMTHQKPVVRRRSETPKREPVTITDDQIAQGKRQIEAVRE